MGTSIAGVENIYVYVYFVIEQLPKYSLQFLNKEDSRDVRTIQIELGKIRFNSNLNLYE